MILIQQKLDINMGKQFKIYDTEKTEKPEGIFEETKLCAANGTYCLLGCTYEEDKKCARLEERKKEKRK
jgi:hypothetical protein